MSYTNLGGQQVLKTVYDDTNDSLKTTIVGGSVTAVVSGLDKVEQPTTNAFGTINSSAGAWTQLIASTSAEIRMIHLFDTTGVALQIGVGGSGSEIIECILGPGNDQPIGVLIPSGSRISIRSNEAAPTAGYVIINYLG